MAGDGQRGHGRLDTLLVRTQAGHLARTGGDDSGALSGFNAEAREKENEGEPVRSCGKGEEGGGPVRVTPHGGRGRMGPGIPAAAREQRR
jgi:hypothetical protein